MPPPDLLCHAPEVRVDAAQLKQTLTFAFASGVPSTAFAQLLESASLPASTWEPRSFAEALFLSELVAGAMKVTIGGRAYAVDCKNLKRILGRPPSDSRKVVEFRRQIMAELVATPALRRDLEAVYVALHQFRNTPRNAAPSAAPRREPEATRHPRRRQDGRGRHGRRVWRKQDGSRPIARVRWSGHWPATRTVACAICSTTKKTSRRSTCAFASASTVACAGWKCWPIKENESNWFYASPMGRFLSRLSSHLPRKDCFSEQELLVRLIDGVFEGLEDELVQLFQLIGDLEFYLAGLAFRDLAESHGLGVCLPEPIAPARMRTPDAPARTLRARSSTRFSWRRAWRWCRVISSSSRHDMTVIVTGPNSGGKTRLLQSVAIAQMLGQSGFFVPAREATLGVAPGLFVSLIEEATADQKREGRLGMELIRIRSLFEKLRVGLVVVLDELCSGTNPSEGEEYLRAGHQFARRAGAASLDHDPLPSIGGAYCGGIPPYRSSPFSRSSCIRRTNLSTYRFIPGSPRPPWRTAPRRASG